MATNFERMEQLWLAKILIELGMPESIIETVTTREVMQFLEDKINQRQGCPKCGQKS